MYTSVSETRPNKYQRSVSRARVPSRLLPAHSCLFPSSSHCLSPDGTRTSITWYLHILSPISVSFMARCFDNLGLASTFRLTQRQKEASLPCRLRPPCGGNSVSINPGAGRATAGRNGLSERLLGSAGIHNTAGALGGSASKWGLGVFTSILGNDLHYEA